MRAREQAYEGWSTAAAPGGRTFEGAFAAGWSACQLELGRTVDDGPTSEQIDLARFVLSEDFGVDGHRKLQDRAAEILFAALGGEGDVDE